MNSQAIAILLTVFLGAISTGIGLVLYRYGEAIIKYKGARFGGAVAIAGVSFYLMSDFYFRIVDVDSLVRNEALKELQIAVHEYDTCIAHEGNKEELACKFQADSLRDAADQLLE